MYTYTYIYTYMHVCKYAHLHVYIIGTHIYSIIHSFYTILLKGPILAPFYNLGNCSTENKVIHLEGSEGRIWIPVVWIPSSCSKAIHHISIGYNIFSTCGILSWHRESLIYLRKSLIFYQCVPNMNTCLLSVSVFLLF